MNLVTPRMRQRAQWLAELRDEVGHRAAHGGAICPVCLLPARIWRRSIHHTMVEALATLYFAGGTETYHHLPTLRNGYSGDDAKLVYWSLIEEEPEAVRDDGGRAGWWRCTEAGRRFLYGELAVVKYKFTYGGKVIDESGSMVTVEDCYREAFDLAVLKARS